MPRQTPPHDCSPPSEFQRIQRRSAMQRFPEDAAPSPSPSPPPPLDDEGELKTTAEAANGFHLFLGNLGVEVDEAFLTRVFSKLASFVPGSARVKRQPDGTTRCYGYVTFSEQRDVDAAVAEFEGQLVGTGRVRLSPCLYNSKARRLLPAHLRERCEMQKRLFFQERFRWLNEGEHQTWRSRLIGSYS